MEFNGEGKDGYGVSPDTLVPAVKRYQGEFKWINHTFSHLNLDSVNYATAKAEITQNVTAAKLLGLRQFSVQNMVTPDVSGLENPDFLRAAYDAGIRYLVTDSSRPGYANPSPNAGLYNMLQPQIFMIPRYPTSLFVSVSSPSEWEYTYNTLYRGYWGRDLSVSEIIDIESDRMLGYLLRGDTNPVMFHAANLRAYDGTHTLLTDLLDAVLAKYNRHFKLPIQSPTMNALGEVVKKRTAYDSCGLNGWIVDGSKIALMTLNSAATVPVTGVRYGTKVVLYGGQYTSEVAVKKGSWVYIPLQSPVFDAVTPVDALASEEVVTAP
jgi:hypothetical protein